MPVLIKRADVSERSGRGVCAVRPGRCPIREAVKVQVAVLELIGLAEVDRRIFLNLGPVQDDRPRTLRYAGAVRELAQLAAGQALAWAGDRSCRALSRGVDAVQEVRALGVDVAGTLAHTVCTFVRAADAGVEGLRIYQTGRDRRALVDQ